MPVYANKLVPFIQAGAARARDTDEGMQECDKAALASIY